MNPIFEVCLVSLTLAANLGLPVAAQYAAASQGTLSLKCGFAGTWKGTTNGLPGIELTIREEERKLGGDMVFYFQERADVNSPWKATGEYTAPLLATHRSGNTMTFQVEHHVCHTCKEVGPNVVFRMELEGVNQAKLTRFEEDGSEGASMKLLRGHEASMQVAPPPQPGISVDMPVTRHATPMPEADRGDALIVTVTSDGRLYLGTNLRDPNLLVAGLQEAISSLKTGKTVYIKPDARTPYATVMAVVDSATAAGFERAVLLTSQPNSPHPQAIAPPQGFTILTRSGSD